MKKLNLNVASEYLVLASELMYLKSKTLLPKTEDEDESDEYIEAKEDLINRLLEYKQYKEVTNTLRVLEESRSEIFTKEMSNLEDYRNEEIKLNDDISLEDLVDAFKKYLERMEYKKPISTRVATKEISVKERRQSIRKILLKKKKVEFFDLFEDFSKPYVVATFLSILEMAKEKELVIKQENNFDKIYCEAIWWNQY